MDQNLNAKRRSDVETMHVKLESVDDDASALDLGSRESPAPSDDTAEGGLDPSTEEQAAATNTHILLYPVSTDRFLIPSGDEKTFLKISPASAVLAPPPEKWSAPNSDFSSKAVMCLIEAVGRRWGLYETRERSQLFQSVQEELAGKGHVLPVEKIRRKWNNLIVTYKRVKDRSRETGHAKTSWEFFDLMNATLGDTVGAQIVNNNKNRTSTTLISTALKKIAAKPQVPESIPHIRSYGDFGATGTMKSMALVNTNTQMNNNNNNNSNNTTSSNNNISTASITTIPMATAQTKVSEMKPLVLLNSNVVTTSVQPATLAPSTSLLSSPYPTDTPSPSVSLGLTNSMDPLLKTHPYLRLKAPSLPPAVIHSRLGAPELDPNLQGLSSPFPACGIPPCFTSPGAEGLGPVGGEEQSSAYMLQEVLRRQEEQAYTEQGARRRAEARERRRERREVRMADSLGRIATALELLSSKQDTVIALLQRLADKK